MDYRPLVIAKIKEFSERHPDMTVGAILYSAMNMKYKNADFTKGNLYETKDSEFYALLSKALVEANQED